MAKFTYAGAQVSMRQYADSYSTLSNTLAEVAAVGYTNETSLVERSLLNKYEMPDLEIVDAMKVFAGMTAAELGMGDVATNYANQVSEPYRNKVIRFIR